ncbi:MAG TPA: hypothetical protein RMF84_18395 [Polyangiaceae bacterium LLY-WYZ-14_1]|nr:hypothetical protein [Polyangiaceae bacterium LLY-WYZ-14_1]
MAGAPSCHMQDALYFLPGTPTIASWFVLAFAAVVVGGGLVGIRRSFQSDEGNVAGAYGVAGLFAILLLFAVGQGAYAVDMMMANAEELTMPVTERAAYMVQVTDRARASLFFAGLGAAIAFPMSVFLFLRFLYLRRDKKLPEGQFHHEHPLEAGQGSSPADVR